MTYDTNKLSEEQLRERVIDVGGHRTYRYPESQDELWVLSLQDLAKFAAKADTPPVALPAVVDATEHPMLHTWAMAAGLANVECEEAEIRPFLQRFAALVLASSAPAVVDAEVVASKPGRICLDEAVLVSLFTVTLLGAYRSVRISNPDPDGAEELVLEVLAQVKRFS